MAEVGGHVPPNFLVQIDPSASSNLPAPECMREGGKKPPKALRADGLIIDTVIIQQSDIFRLIRPNIQLVLTSTL